MAKTVNLTEPRRVILEVIRNATDHPTAADIMEKLAQEGNRFAYATVYNSLKYLTDHGLIQELNIGNGVTRYDGRLENHHHFICEQCGSISEIATPLPSDWLSQLESQTGFQIDKMNIHFTGLCSSCRQMYKRPN
ncbi:Fur family transcriptional regulator [Alicyclobacillus tolerans]|uniref:Fur family peroxide stress response transcriptional regulator n=2 Tax=Alicyclobacillus tolerans TaxID=90970 RepID=A0ABT9LUK5_9BACL|nr:MULTISPECIES: transcriptional repressor [Alicyclobacillus]MDP9727955.1 Fur family peroxide stress response transcriptional regulator [Alicyclobacillus tengchongensis]QRF24252.1 transcriptional repressor [Alicyclobacillus sp. TC]SHK63439.1 Fur family transcriptional regulator, peroxide stress response regulator [Alicyclobacillus montanus]